MSQEGPRFIENPIGKYVRAADSQVGSRVMVKPAGQYTPGSKDKGFRDICHMDVVVLRVEETRQAGNQRVIVMGYDGKEYALGAGTATQREGREGYDWPKIRTERRLALERKKRIS